MKWPTALNLKIDAGDGNLTLYVGLDADVLVYETGALVSYEKHFSIYSGVL